MKPTTLLLIASLLANVALVTLVATRSAAPSATPGPNPTKPERPSAGSARTDDALRAALISGTQKDLEAAGLSPELARELSLGRSFSRVVARLRTEKAAQSDGRWWRSGGNQSQSREGQLLRQRELSDALAAAFGDDAGLFVSLGSTDKNSFLPPAKREALRRITQDYDEMMAKFSAGGVQLASDKEKLKLLRAERERDIAALLSPEELLAFEMRTSPTAATVKSRYGEGIQTEDDYRKIYALQKAFDEKSPLEALSGRITPETMRARAEAQKQLQDDIRAALGESAYAGLRRATDPDLRTVDSLVARLNLPPATTDQVALARESFAAASQRISADTAVPLAQRRAQIQELGTRARSEIQKTLGTEAAEAYAQRSPWMGMLQNGLAYSTTPRPGSPGALLPGASSQSVYPIMPTGTGSGGQRQVIMSGTATTSDVPAAHGELFLGGPATGTRENIQVMTFSSTTTDGTPAPADGTGTTQRMIIVSPPPAPPPPK